MTKGGYVSRYERHDLRRRNYAVTKGVEDEPTLFLETEPNTWTTRRAKAYRFPTKDAAETAVINLRGPSARAGSPYKIIRLAESKKAV